MHTTNKNSSFEKLSSFKMKNNQLISVVGGNDLDPLDLDDDYIYIDVIDLSGRRSRRRVRRTHRI